MPRRYAIIKTISSKTSGIDEQCSVIAFSTNRFISDDSGLLSISFDLRLNKCFLSAHDIAPITERNPVAVNKKICCVMEN